MSITKSSKKHILIKLKMNSNLCFLINFLIFCLYDKKNLKMKIVILMGEESNRRVPDISSSLKEFSTQ